MKLYRLFRHLLFILLLLSATSSWALIEFEDAVFPELATSGAALAMGNAYICRVDDSSAVFYNPAGLGSVRYPHLHLSNFHIETNKGWLNTATGGKIGDAGSNVSKGFSLEGNRQLLEENPGTMNHMRFHMLPNFTARYFSMGYLLSKRTRARLGREAGALYEYADRLDHGPYVALNASLFGGVLKFGVSGILLNRNEIFGEQDPATEVTVTGNDYKKGIAIITTAGVRLTLPVTFLPTFAATMHNALNQDFSGRAAGPPEAIKQTLDVGFSITPQIGRITRIHLEANLKDVGGEYDGVDFKRRMLLGLEFSFARVMFLRFGYGDGFGSAGLGIRSRKLEFDLTTYAVDTTTSSFRGEEDRRFSMTISSGF